MTWRNRTAGLALTTMLALATPARAADDGTHEHSGREHATVRISRSGVEPAIRHATPEDAIVWLNYARIPVRIRLEPAASTRIHCREPSHFRLGLEGYLVASPVEPLGAASLCLLAPGTYDYTVEELDTAARPPRLVPGGRRMSGQIVITEAATESSRGLARLASHHRALAQMEERIAKARDRLADLLAGSGDHSGAANARRRARAAEATAAWHEAEAINVERDLNP